MITLKNIVVSFGNIKVLKNLNATINQGDFITVIGANGAGKSTLFDLISGKTLPESGEILLDGKPITHLDELGRASFIGRLFQNTHLSSVPSMTVRENLAMATYKKGVLGLRSGLKDFPAELIESVIKPMNLNLDMLLDTPIGALSGGQRQIISFIMATLVPPKILLLDEPTAALDPASSTKLLVFAAKFIKAHNITTLMVTHNPYLATTLGNRLWVVEDGIIKRAYGPEKQELETTTLIKDIDYKALAVWAHQAPSDQVSQNCTPFNNMRTRN